VRQFVRHFPLIFFVGVDHERHIFVAKTTAQVVLKFAEAFEKSQTNYPFPLSFKTWNPIFCKNDFSV
jgi:hypothetical protein